jgi:hypothetical protein
VKTTADGRIGFGDLKRLQRDVLPARITTREEAELLLFLDAAVQKADRDWPPYLTATVRGFCDLGAAPGRGRGPRQGSLDLGSAVTRRAHQDRSRPSP